MNHNELTLGQVRAMYFDDTALELPPVPLYRLDVKGSRHYFTLDEDGEPQFYAGVTSVTGATLPKPEQLVKWIADMGYENAIRYRDERAAYGTLMHTVFAYILTDGRLPLDMVNSLVEQYVKRENLAVNVWQWTEDLKQDVIAFAQWVADYDVQPLAIEISLCSSAMGVAGTVDLPCLLTIPTKGQWGEVYKSGPQKGKPKETTKDVRYLCIVDFKSGRKSYGGDVGCAAQLALYRDLWVENFDTTGLARSLNDVPDDFPLPIRTFNWSPKDWCTTPGYHFVEQTLAFHVPQMDAMLAMYKASEKPVGERTKTFYRGEVKLGEVPIDCYVVKSAPELASEKLNEEPPADLESRMWEYLTVGDLIASAERQANIASLEATFAPKGEALR